MNTGLEYFAADSVIHRINTRNKMIGAFAVMLLALLSANIYYLAAILGLVLVIAVIAGIMGRIAGSLKGLALFSIVLILLQVLFSQEGQVWFYLLPGGYIPVRIDAVILGMAMSLRMMAIVVSFSIFLVTTRFQDIFRTLTDLKLPCDYVFMFMTALRFIPVFLEEISQVRDAQASRGCMLDGKNIFIKIKSYGIVAVPLVIISLQKAERIAIAMETRGYGRIS